MAHINWLILFISALVPIIVGFFYYGPLFGKSWMDVNGFKKEDLESSNMAFMLGISIILSFLLALGLSGITIHQSAVLQLLATDLMAGSEEANEILKTVMATYGDKHMDFGHGAMHGGTSAVLIALPFIAINAVFERRGGKYILIHFGYWFISLVLMGGLINHFW